MSSRDKFCPVKVHEETELALQNAFTPLKNPDRRVLQCQLLILDMSLTMLAKSWLLSASQLSGYRPICGPPAGINVSCLADLLKKINESSSTDDGGEEEQGIDLQLVAHVETWSPT